MNRLALVVLLVGVGAAAFLGVVAWERGAHGNLAIKNGSGLPIQLATVEVGGTKLEFEGIQPSETRTEKFEIRGDAHYVVSVRFASGKVLSGACGYVTNGVDSSDVLTVRGDGIRISSSNSESDKSCPEQK